MSLAVLATIITSLVTLISLAFSARGYLGAGSESKKRRVQIYYQPLKTISKGMDSEDPLKLVSQITLISELQKCPEYSSSSQQALKLLRQDWSAKGPAHIMSVLMSAIDETLTILESRG